MANTRNSQSHWNNLCDFVEHEDDVKDMSPEEIDEYLKSEGIDTTPALNRLMEILDSMA
jgi:hypothetical protein